ncbi:MAG: hypothetical protein WCH04_21760 [Gammaproteobacteria bacterium]
MTVVSPPDIAGKPTGVAEDGTVVLPPHRPVIGDSRHGGGLVITGSGWQGYSKYPP